MPHENYHAMKKKAKRQLVTTKKGERTKEAKEAVMMASSSLATNNLNGPQAEAMEMAKTDIEHIIEQVWRHAGTAEF